MKIIFITSFLCLASALAFCQTSPVVLSGLKVTAVINAASPELNGFFVELRVSDPAELAALELTDEDSRMGSKVTYFLPVQQIEGKTALILDKHTIPFEGQNIRFLLQVRDQLKSNYHKLEIHGNDKGSRVTNSLTYNQSN